MSLQLSNYVYPRDSWEFVKQQAGVPIQCVPQELILHIFSFLSLSDLGRTSCVCRDWKILAADDSLWNVKNLFPSLKIIDKAVWETHVDLKAFGLDIEDDSCLDKREMFVLKRLLALEIENDAGITLLTMPKGLTLNKLAVLAESPKQGYSTQLYFGPFLSEPFENISVEKTYKVAISNSVLKRSRDLSVDDQQKLVNENGCEMPEALPVSTLVILTYMSSGARLYGDDPFVHSKDNPLTFTRCREKIDGNNMNVGGFSFARAHLSVRSSYDYVDCNFGSGAMHEFQAPLNSESKL